MSFFRHKITMGDDRLFVGFDKIGNTQSLNEDGKQVYNLTEYGKNCD